MKESLVKFGIISSIGSVGLLFGQPAQAVTLDNGLLAVDLNDNNGAISSVLFGGSEFYREGTFVSNYGFQNGTNTGTFVTFNANGSEPSPVNVSSNGSSVTATGTYRGGGANIGFSRVYSLVPGLNVLRTTITLANGGADTNISLFETFDPDQGQDQGNGFGTNNDVTTIETGVGTATAGQATETGGLSVVIGTLNGDATVAAGGPFGIFGGVGLNNFFNAPIDGNGSFADLGTHVGLRTLLDAGTSLTFRYDQAFGLTSGAAQDAFIAANASKEIPTPALLPGLIGMGVAAFSKKRKGEAAAEEA